METVIDAEHNEIWLCEVDPYFSDLFFLLLRHFLPALRDFPGNFQLQMATYCTRLAKASQKGQVVCETGPSGFHRFIMIHRCLMMSDVSGCHVFQTFPSTGNACATSMLTGEALGDLASAAEYATDAAIAKLVKDRVEGLCWQPPNWEMPGLSSWACFCDLRNRKVSWACHWFQHLNLPACLK